MKKSIKAKSHKTAKKAAKPVVKRPKPSKQPKVVKATLPKPRRVKTPRPAKVVEQTPPQPEPKSEDQSRISDPPRSPVSVPAPSEIPAEGNNIACPRDRAHADTGNPEHGVVDKTFVSPPDASSVRRKIVALLIGLALLLTVATRAHGQSGTQGQLVTDVELKSATTSGTTINNCRSVTFIFRSSFTGTVGGIAFTASDVPLTVRADNGNVLRAIPYSVTAGTLVIAQTH